MYYYFFIAKLEPFRLEFVSDGFEGAAAAIKEGLTKGFKVSFFQKTCWRYPNEDQKLIFNDTLRARNHLAICYVLSF